jgi:hypothetical protein
MTTVHDLGEYEIRLWLGNPPPPGKPGTGPTNRTPDPATRYLFLYPYASAVGNTVVGKHRLAIRHGRPICIEAFDGTSWQQVQQLGEKRSFEVAENGGYLRLRLKIDEFEERWRVDGDPHQQLRQWSRDSIPGLRLGIVSSNWLFSIAVYAVQRSPAHVRTPLPSNVPLDAALRSTSGPVSGAITVGPDGPVADVFGNELQDVAVYHPGRWISPRAPWPPALADLVQYNESQEWDDLGNYGHAYGTLIVDNHFGQMNGAHGVRTAPIVAFSPYGSALRARAITGAGGEGVKLLRSDPLRQGQLDWHDPSIKLMDAIAYDMILDGYALHEAVRMLCMAGNISPRFLVAIPNPGPPPYPASYPFPVLGVGSPDAPRYAIRAGTQILSAILRLVADYGAQYVEMPDGRVKAYPYIFWVDPEGLVHCEAWMADRQPVVALYTSLGPDDPFRGVYPIINRLETINSTQHLRTDIVVQGMDPVTYDLIHAQASIPQNIWQTGWRKWMLIRSPAIMNEDAARFQMRLAIDQSNLPSQMVRFQSVFNPNLFAGQVILVEDESFGCRPFTVSRLDTQIPPGVSEITARSLGEAFAIA